MKTRNLENQTWNFPKRIFLVFLVFIVLFFIRYAYLALATNIDGINLQEFASNRNTYSTTLYAKRGSIYDINGSLLAVNTTSYTVIAYLSPSRTTNSDKPRHVIDKQLTAKSLAPIINMSEERILSLLNKDLYQVELGPGGRNITQLQKDEIDELNLPGIDFVESTKRYYPNGDFASYLIGYAKVNEVIDKLTNSVNYSIDGELGIESYFDESLKGKNGFLKYEQDSRGYKIPDTNETKIEAVNGNDIYLTIDSGIQRFLELAIDNIEEKSKPEWMSITIMDAKTGDILGSASTPSYDPNILNIKNYENPLVSFVYEPGSTMKTYTYMCALEKGTYVGSEKFMSGSYTIGDATIHDVVDKGWGSISYDEGYLRSSNVGVANIVNKFINKSDLNECLINYGFGKKTEIDLPREMTGKVKFNYPIEVAAAAYGQGISITAIQQLQALTMISNNGKMLKPHIVSKIVDVNTGKITYERKIEESEQKVSLSTVEYMKDLMYRTVNGDANFNYKGNGYSVSGYDIIGKTGTAQIYNNETGSYSDGGYNYIYSFAGMFPKENPEYIVYAVMKKPQIGGNSYLKTTVKEVIKNIAKYKNMYSSNNKSDNIQSFEMPNYLNKDTKDVKIELEKYDIDVTIIGDGDKIISTYPSQKQNLISYDRVILFTNGKNILMPDIKGWSSKEAIFLFDKLNLLYEIKGSGYVVSQSIKPGTDISKIPAIEITLKNAIET